MIKSVFSWSVYNNYSLITDKRPNRESANPCKVNWEENLFWHKMTTKDTLYLKQQMIFQDPLDWLQQKGAQREGALQSSLPIPEELG